MSWHYLQGGGGILGGKLLGWRTVCAVEYAAHALRSAARAAARWTPAAVPLSGMTCEPSTASPGGRGRCCQRRVPCNRHQQQRTQTRACRRTERTMARHGPHHWRSSTPLRVRGNVAAPCSRNGRRSRRPARSGLMHAGTCWELPTLGPQPRERVWIVANSRHRTRSSSREFCVLRAA